jgi:hypothetical protein
LFGQRAVLNTTAVSSPYTVNADGSGSVTENARFVVTRASASQGVNIAQELFLIARPLTAAGNLLSGTGTQQ